MNDIILGDAYKLIKEVPDKSVDLIVTDPPYKISAMNQANSGLFRDKSKNKNCYATELNKQKETILRGIDYSILNEFVRVMKKINCYIWCNKEQIYDYMTFFVKEHKCNFEILIWAKSNPIPLTCGHYIKDKEYCLFFWERGAKVQCTTETGKTFFYTAINQADKKKYGHPTIKPEEIIKDLILNSSQEGEVVLDPFSGSGTTCAVAKALGRQYLGFEINEKWHKVSLDRLQGIDNKAREIGLMQERLF